MVFSDVCSSSERRCADGACVSQSSWCDQIIDCADASDEKNCSKTSPLSHTRVCGFVCWCVNPRSRVCVQVVWTVWITTGWGCECMTVCSSGVTPRLCVFSRTGCVTELMTAAITPMKHTATVHFLIYLCVCVCEFSLLVYVGFLVLVSNIALYDVSFAPVY